MSEEYRAKVFRSGNSLALRLPKALGLEDGTEMRIVRVEASTFKVEPLEKPKRKFNIDKVWGCAAGSGLELVDGNDRTFEHRPLLPEDPEWLAAIESRE